MHQGPDELKKSLLFRSIERWVTPLRALGVVVLGAAAGAGCEPVDGAPSSSGECATPQEGCACGSEGVTVGCSETDSYIPGSDQAQCRTGKRTCGGGHWGACIPDGNKTFQSVSLTKIQSTPTPCLNNPCDPSCTEIPESEDDVPLGPGTGLIEGDGGGITLDPDGGAINGTNCTNLQCQINPCTNSGGYQATKISGAVYDPAGLNPLPGVLVYVPNSTPTMPADGVSCDGCSLGSGDPIVSTTTDYKGEFTLAAVPSGTNIPLVIQSGKWVRLITLPSVTACQTNDFMNTDAADGLKLIRFPKNRSEGNIPRIAFVSGSADPFQCVLMKMGMDVSAATSEVGVPIVNNDFNPDRIHYYQGTNSAGRNLSSALGGGAPSASTLWSGGLGNGAACTTNADCTSLSCTGQSVTSAITNGGFESLTTGWTMTGSNYTASTTKFRSGVRSMLLGAASAATATSTNSAAQTFTSPAAGGTLSFYYYMYCNDGVAYDWATATLKNNSSGSTSTILAKTCQSSTEWQKVSVALAANTSYTLTLTNRNDNNPGDGSWTYFDDVSVTTTGTCQGGNSRLEKYDAIILACEGGEYDKGSTVNQAIADYAASGGRVFATHFSYAFLEFAPSATGWPQVVQSWNHTSYPADPMTTYINRGFPKGDTFALWLDHVGASSTIGQLDILEGRHDYDYVDRTKATPWLRADSGNNTAVAGVNTACSSDANCPNSALECQGSGNCQDASGCVANGGTCGVRTKMCSAVGDCTGPHKACTSATNKVCAVETKATTLPAGFGTACTTTTANTQGTCTDTNLACNGPAGKCQDGSSCSASNTCGTRTDACKTAADCSSSSSGAVCTAGGSTKVCAVPTLLRTGTTAPTGSGSTSCTSVACPDNGLMCVVNANSGTCSNKSTTTCSADATCANQSNTNIITNGTFESNVSGWTNTGSVTRSNVRKHSGTYSALLGYNGISGAVGTNTHTMALTFTSPVSTSATLSFWYYHDCNDVVANDYFKATLKDNGTNMTSTLQANVCNTTKQWRQITVPLASNTSYTLTFTNYLNSTTTNRSWTFIDDVTLTSTGTCNGETSTCQQKNNCTPGNDATCGTDQYCHTDSKCYKKTAGYAVGRCDTASGLCSDGVTACSTDAQCGSQTMTCTGSGQGTCAGSGMQCVASTSIGDAAGTAARYTGYCTAAGVVGKCVGLTCGQRSCTLDSDCLTGEGCLSNKCVKYEYVVGKCDNGKCPDDTDCSTDAECGTRTQICTSDGDCDGANTKCKQSNTQVKTYNKFCTYNGTSVGLCDGPTCQPGSCASDDDCGNGFFCDNGVCKEHNMEPLMTFNVPVGAAPEDQCGRVVFSDFHVSASALSGSASFPDSCISGPLSSQEKALEYMLFDLTACLTPDYNPGPAAINYQPVTVTRDYYGECDQGEHPVWHYFDWMTETPGNSNIQFSVQSGETLATLKPASPAALATVSGAPVTVWTGVDVSTVLSSQNPVVPSGLYLRVTITLNPSSDHALAPTLTAWRQSYSCVPSE